MDKRLENFSIPVIVILFNRPDYTQQLFDALQLIKPRKLYIVADGPRIGWGADLELVQKTRDIFNHVNWDSEIVKVYSDINLGCGARVSSGLDYVFTKEEYAIILEDDCVPSDSFFIFCKELLERYKDDETVMHIAGSNFTEKISPQVNDYFFTIYGHIWGWATWARAWKLFDFKMKMFPEWLSSGAIENYGLSKREKLFFVEKFEQYFNNPEAPWGYRWFFTRLIHNGLSAVPRKNLVTNIGLQGTHVNLNDQNISRKVADFLSKKPISHPKIVEADSQVDTLHFDSHISPRISKLSRIRRKISSMINRWKMR